MRMPGRSFRLRRWYFSERARSRWKAGCRGFTRVDLIVTIGIIALLCAFFMPAGSRSAKRTAKKLECLGNLRQVAIAAMNYASNSGGDLPPLVGSIPDSIGGDKPAPLLIGWPVALLPALDAAIVLKSIKQNAIRQSDGLSDYAKMNPKDQIDLAVFHCPEDPNRAAHRGAMSYVINFGFIPQTLFSGDPNGEHRLGAVSWNENDTFDEVDDINISAATGVTWRPSPSFKPSLDYVATGDGMSSTLLMTENLQAGHWYDTETTALGFGVPIPTTAGRVVFGQGQWFESVAKPLNADVTGGELNDKKARDWLINADSNLQKGVRPRPSSAHVGGVNAIFCDGSGRFLNEQIDPRVYIKLITPNGVTFGEKHFDSRAY